MVHSKAAERAHDENGPPVLMRFAGVPGAIAIHPGLEELSEALHRVFVGWPHRATGGMPCDAVLMTASGSADAVAIAGEAGAWECVEPSIASAVSTIAVALVSAFVEERPDTGNLHAGAVEIDGRLVVFPATNRAGKSTLVSAFAARGYRVFADDLLPVDLKTGEAIASGCLPRPRVPLPESAPDWLKVHTRSNAVVTDGYYAYLSAGAARDVRHRARCPIGAIVVLDRSEAPCATRIEDISISDALFHLLRQDTRRRAEDDETFDRYLDLARSVPVRRLVYSDIESAMVAIKDGFSGWHARNGAREEHEMSNETTAVATDLLDEAQEQDFSAIGKDGGTIYRCRSGLRMRDVDDTVFLVDETTGDIHHLNPLGRAIWQMLDGEMSDRAISGMIKMAFPETPPETIDADVVALLDEFRTNGLIVPAR